MKVGIISDTHGSVQCWTKAYNRFFKDVDLIVHAGDVLYHGPRNPILADYNPGKLAEILNECPVPIIFGKGNCDSEVDGMVLNLPIESPYGYVMMNGLRIVVTHGHLLSDEEKVVQAKKFKADLFVTGHTHVAEVYKKDHTIFLNPGSPSMTKRNDHRSTIAILDEEKVQIIDVDSEEVVESVNLV